MTLDEVVAAVPVIRQSLLQAFDDCTLSSYFDMRYASGWSTSPQAGGTIMHRALAEVLRTMKRVDSEGIAPADALVILEEALEQRDVAPEDRVRVPMRDIPQMRTTMIKFAKDNSFSIRNVVDVEKRISATVRYVDDEGEIRDREITGQLDALIADPNQENGAIVLDWKYTWGIPGGTDQEDWPEKAGLNALSYHGFFQLRLYAWLVMRNYKSIETVTLREFYPTRTVARKARIHRGQLATIEKMISDIVLEFDRAYASGKPKRLRFPDVAPWNPSPGKHCAFCLLAARCPIERQVREQITVTSESEARRAVAELEVAEAVRESRREALRPYIERTGRPIASKWSRGRRALGLKVQKNGKAILTFFTPVGADRAPARKEEDAGLEDALKRSVAKARADRDDAPEDSIKPVEPVSPEEVVAPSGEGGG
jgi:hypothetical protein